LKKYVFIAFCLGITFSLAFSQWGAAGALMALLFSWVFLENSRRSRFRFLQGTGFDEASFELGGDPAQMEISADGSCAVFVSSDGSMSMRSAKGVEIWRMPCEPGILAWLPLPGGACYYAVGDELVLLNPEGQVVARLPFDPPPFRQSYRLSLSGDASTLMFHTPWFLMLLSPDLKGESQRVDASEAGHYLKYAAISPAGDRVFFAGAKLLEGEQATEARWGSWKKSRGKWGPDWAQAAEGEGGGNSHLRGARFSADGAALLLELYQEGYEFRILGPDGSLKWRRAGVEHPVLSPDASLVLWESKIDGLVLADTSNREKLWSMKPQARIRHKQLASDGTSLLLEGNRFKKIGRDGSELWQALFKADPYRITPASGSAKFAMVYMNRCGFLSLRP
jgi:hypothetical protein